MNCDNPTWITYAINGMLFIGGLLCIALMQKAEHDQQINRIDAKWIRNARRLSFISIALFAWSAAITDIAPITLLLLLMSTAVLLTIDILGMNRRPPNGLQYLSSQSLLNTNSRQQRR